MAPPRSKVPQQILDLIAKKPMTGNEVADALQMNQTYVCHMLRDLRQAHQVRVTSWVRRGSVPTQVWTKGDPRVEPDVPRPERGPRVWKPHAPLPDEDFPSDFPRTVHDPLRGITRHYSGVQQQKGASA